MLAFAIQGSTALAAALLDDAGIDDLGAEEDSVINEFDEAANELKVEVKDDEVVDCELEGKLPVTTSSTDEPPSHAQSDNVSVIKPALLWNTCMLAKP